MKKEIPIENIYYLLSYAWDFILPSFDKIHGNDKFTNSSNLMARLLSYTFRSLLKRGLSKEYTSICDDVVGIKGKLNLTKTISSGKLIHGKTICEYDEHNFDHLSNQIIKASMKRILAQKDLDYENVLLLKTHIHQLESVSDILLNRNMFLKVRHTAVNRYYLFAMELCKLIELNLVVSSRPADLLLNNFFQETMKRHDLFECFIRNFYKRHLATLSNVEVERRNFEWDIGKSTPNFLARIPKLKTDVVIDRNGTRLIIDTKFYADAMTENDGTQKYRREHLSQIMEYLRTSKKKINTPTVGMLLYPTVSESIYDSGIIEGLDIRIATIDLGLPWDKIESRLLDLVLNADSTFGVAA